MRVEVTIYGQRDSGKTELAKIISKAVIDTYGNKQLELGKLLQEAPLAITIDEVTPDNPPIKRRVIDQTMENKVVITSRSLL